MRGSGQFSGKLDGGEGVARAHQDVAVEPGQPYRFTGQWRNGDKTAEFDVVYAEVIWLDQPGGKPVAQPVGLDSGLVAGAWKPFEVPGLVAPANARGARIQLRSRFGVGAFDKLSFGPAGEGTGSSAVASAPADMRRVPGGGSSQVAVGGSLGWHTDLATARQAASAQNKPLLVYVFDPEAENCQHLENQVMAQQEVQQALQNYVLLRLSPDTNRDLLYSMRIYRAGTIAVYGPEGTFRQMIQDRLPAAEFARRLK